MCTCKPVTISHDRCLLIILLLRLFNSESSENILIKSGFFYNAKNFTMVEERNMKNTLKPPQNPGEA